MASAWLDRAVMHAVDRIGRLASRADGFPVSTGAGLWRLSERGTWTAGFWPGRLWLTHLLTGEASFAECARAWCAALKPWMTDKTTHDLGMIFMPSWVLGHRVTGEASFRDGALTAAKTLAARFNDRGRYIRALGAPGDPDNRGYVIVDTLMNVPLLFWATAASGDNDFAEVARAHVDTSKRCHVRADGSTWQVHRFDADTGEAVGPDVYQGLSVDSYWSRGQAWAICGLATVHAWEGDRDDPEAARRTADWWIDHTKSRPVPLWDFGAPDHDPLDSSAAAIAACGLLVLGEELGEARYRDHGLMTAEALFETCAAAGPLEEGILLHGTGVQPRGREIDVSLSYGDYFYVELLLRLKSPELANRYLSPRSHR